MIHLAWAVFGFAVLQLVIALVNLFFYERLPKSNKTDALISLLIPARNEEKNIGNLLNDLLLQDYKNVEIIVFNDHSTDKTAEIVERYSLADDRIKLINSNNLPAGWLGKNHGCFQLAKHAKGEFFLFLDADVGIKGNAIGQTTEVVSRQKLGLLSVFPKQIMKTAGEKMTVPLMHYILLTLLPLILVSKSRFSSLAAANGQFMLFDAETYRQTQPHKKMRSEMVEDIKIARWYKSLNIGVTCLANVNSISCRMYTGFSDAVHGFSKNVGQFFGNSLFVAGIFWIVTTLGFLPVFTEMKPEYIIVYVAVLLATRIVVSVSANQNIGANLLFILPQQVALAMFILKSFVNQHRKMYEWKGRKIA